MLKFVAAILLTTFSVVDGDTIHADGVKIRLWGIDAPETHQPGGKEATHALSAITRGGTLTCEKMDIDRYGRIVARCFLPSGADIACLMVQSGNARDWPKYSRGYYAGCSQ